MKLANADHFLSDNPRIKFQNPKSFAYRGCRKLLAACLLAVSLLTSSVGAQSKPLRELNVAYPFGGSTSYFWVAYRSGSFEKHGLRLQPIFIRGGVLGVQALLAKNVVVLLQGASAVVSAWAQGAKDLKYIGAVGNKLDYILAANKAIRSPADLKGKRVGVSQIGSSSDFIARYALRQIGLNPEKDVIIIAIGAAGERWTALASGQIDASIFQPPLTQLARKTGLTVFVDLAKVDFEYTISGIVTTASFIRAEPETVMNFMRGLADGMDFYRDERNKEKTLRFLGEYFRTNSQEDLEGTRRAYSEVTPGLPFISAKAIENVIVNDRNLSGLGVKADDILDLSFLQKLQQERNSKR